MPDTTSSLVAELEGLTALSSELIGRARRQGVFLVWRAQARRIARLTLKSGRVEDVATSSATGHGIHVTTEDGCTALGSRDDFQAEPAAALLDRTVAAASGAASLGVAGRMRDALEPVVARAVPVEAAAFDRIDLDAAAARLGELQRELAGRVPGVNLSISYQADLDAWRVARSDGTDVLFAMPRCVIRVAASSSGDARHTVGASVSSPAPTLFDDPATVAKLITRAEQAARLATVLPDAPAHPAGAFPLLIDYALAKGLAHEAFGHASEADGFRSSILAKDGRFRVGESVGASHVSIIDEPQAGDHAWQPYSASGGRRLRATIVNHGRLAEALTDPWSYGASGSPLVHADRAESFRSAPLPRMSNIRIEVDDPLPAPGAFEDYDPPAVRDLLARAGVFKRHPRVVFLSGYTGGQVNPATGDFVFNCRAIYVLGVDGLALHKPAIFSGSMFGALSSIREGFGPLLLDAIGTCGKWGQSVPSSGGSHYFLALDPDPSVRLGGR